MSRAPSRPLALGVLQIWFAQLRSALLRRTLRFRGTRDSFSTAEFHRRCDGRPCTLTLVRDTDGSVFGGFADAPWGGAEGYTASTSSFIFCLSLRGTRDLSAAFFAQVCLAELTF